MEVGEANLSNQRCHSAGFGWKQWLLLVLLFLFQPVHPFPSDQTNEASLVLCRTILRKPFVCNLWIQRPACWALTSMPQSCLNTRSFSFRSLLTWLCFTMPECSELLPWDGLIICCRGTVDSVYVSKRHGNWLYILRITLLYEVWIECARQCAIFWHGHIIQLKLP